MVPVAKDVAGNIPKPERYYHSGHIQSGCRPAAPLEDHTLKWFKLRNTVMTSLGALLLAAAPLYADDHGPVGEDKASISGEHATAAEDDATASNMEDLRESWAQTRKELQEEGAKAGAAIRSRTRDALDAMDRKLSRLRDDMHEGWDDLSEATRKRREQAYDALSEERDRLAKWSSEMGERSSSAWDGIRDGAARAWEGLRDGSRKAWSSVRDAFNSDGPPPENVPDESRGE